jgi:hypothetical protein
VARAVKDKGQILRERVFCKTEFKSARYRFFNVYSVNYLMRATNKDSLKQILDSCVVNKDSLKQILDSFVLNKDSLMQIL